MTAWPCPPLSAPHQSSLEASGRAATGRQREKIRTQKNWFCLVKTRLCPRKGGEAQSQPHVVKRKKTKTLQKQKYQQMGNGCIMWTFLETIYVPAPKSCWSGPCLALVKNLMSEKSKWNILCKVLFSSEAVCEVGSMVSEVDLLSRGPQFTFVRYVVDVCPPRSKEKKCCKSCKPSCNELNIFQIAKKSDFTFSTLPWHRPFNL